MFIFQSRDKYCGRKIGHKTLITDALKKNLPFNKDLVVHGGLDGMDGVAGFQKFLNLKTLPDAVFAVNDPVAAGAFITIKKSGLKIPDAEITFG